MDVAIQESWRITESISDAEDLLTEILEPDRIRPIVALTCRRGEQEPAISPERLTDLTEEQIDIRVLKGCKLTRRLEELFRLRSNKFENSDNPHPCPFHGAAAVWWPVNEATGRVGRQLIIDRDGEYGEHHFQQLLSIVRRDDERHRTVAERKEAERKEVKSQLGQANGKVNVLTRENREIRAELSEERQAHGVTRKELRFLREARPTAKPELGFREAVACYWIANVAESGREMKWFTIDDGFEQSVKDCQVVDWDGVVKVVAKLVGGLRENVTVKRWRESDGPDSSTRLDEDGNPYRRIYLKQNCPAAPRLEAVERSDGVFHLVRVGVHDDGI